MSSIMTTNRNSTITAPTYTTTSAMARNSARSSSHSAAAVKNEHQEQHPVHRVARGDHGEPGGEQHGAEGVEHCGFEHCCSSSAIARVGLAVAGDFPLVAIAHGEQHGLGVVQLAAVLPVVLQHARLDDRVHRAGFLAEAAEDALHEVDVVTRGAAGSVCALLGLDVDRERRADRFAQLAGDAALFAVRIAAQRVQAAEARALRRLLLVKLHRDLAREEGPAGEHHAAQQLEQQEAPEEVEHAGHGAVLRAVLRVFISRYSTGSASTPRSRRSTRW